MYRYNQLVFPSHMNKDARFLVLAGFSLNGPVGTPFIIKKQLDPIEVLGDCQLAENVRMAWEYGITPLILRLNGSHGEAEIIHDETNMPVLRFKTFEANDESNNIQIHLFPTHMIIEGLYNQHTYYFDDYKNVDELSEAIKHELYLGTGEVDVEIINRESLQNIVLTEKHVPFANADDGFNYVSDEEDAADEKIEMQLTLLRESLIDEEEGSVFFAGELSGFLIDTIVFTDISYEKAPSELTNILGNFAYSKTNDQTMFCSIVLSTRYFNEERYSEEEEDLYIGELEDLVLKRAELWGGRNDLLKHMEVVIGMQDSIDARRTTMPCAVSYACMRYSQGELYQSATNKSLEHTNNLIGLELKQHEVAKLSSSGYICIVPSIKKGYVPFNSINLYPQSTILSKPHYLRSIHHDVSKITNYFNPNIGEALTANILQTILVQINSHIEIAIEENPFYRDIRLEIVDFTQERIVISLSFDLYGEIESVRTTLEYTPSNEVNVLW